MQAMFDASNIEPVYQPIVDLRDGGVVGYEALARGRGDDGPSSPEALFAAARAHGRVAELDRACREAALDAGYPDNGAPGERPGYHPGYYGAFVLDPDGHNIEAVNHNRTVPE